MFFRHFATLNIVFHLVLCAAKKTATVWGGGIFHIPQKDIFWAAL